MSWCSFAGCVRLRRKEEVNARKEDHRSAAAKDLFVSVCDTFPFRGFLGIMWQEEKGEDVSQVP